MPDLLPFAVFYRRNTDLTQRYLPSAAAARKHLLDHMAELEASQPTRQHSQSQEKPHEVDQTASQAAVVNLEKESLSSGEEKEGRRWAQIYSYSYSQNLTGCVKQLEVLQKYTKEIVGEQGSVLCLLLNKERLANAFADKMRM